LPDLLGNPQPLAAAMLPHESVSRGLSRGRRPRAATCLARSACYAL